MNAEERKNALEAYRIKNLLNRANKVFNATHWLLADKDPSLFEVILDLEDDVYKHGWEITKNGIKALKKEIAVLKRAVEIASKATGHFSTSDKNFGKAFEIALAQAREEVEA